MPAPMPSAARLDLDRIRQEFPALASGFVFLDNAGGSQTLRGVAERVTDYLLHTNVQLGASYAVSQTSTARVLDARIATAAYVGAADPGEVVLGPSTTQLIDNLALAMEGTLAPGDEIVVTNADHHANVGAWQRLAKRGVVVKTWEIDPVTLRLEERALLPLLGPRTRLVAFSHATMKASFPWTSWHEPGYDAASGIPIATTGRPALRYSRNFTGLMFRVSSFVTKGQIATSKPFA